MINVITCRRTCLACPSQWEGVCSDGRSIYIRYRWGCLTFGLGLTIEEAVDNSFNHAGVDFPGDTGFPSNMGGSMTNADMQHLMLEYDVLFAEITGGDC